MCLFRVLQKYTCAHYFLRFILICTCECWLEFLSSCLLADILTDIYIYIPIYIVYPNHVQASQFLKEVKNAHRSQFRSEFSVCLIVYICARPLRPGTLMLFLESHPFGFFYWTYAPLCLWLATFRFCSKIRLWLLLSFLHFVALCGSVRHLRTTFTFVYMQHCKLQLQIELHPCSAQVLPFTSHISVFFYVKHLEAKFCLSSDIVLVFLWRPTFAFQVCATLKWGEHSIKQSIQISNCLQFLRHNW